MEVLDVLNDHIEEFLNIHRGKDLIKVYGPGTTLGKFPNEFVDFETLPYMEKITLQDKKRSALNVYDGFWVYVISRLECFEGRLDHTRVQICQDSSVITKALVPFCHQVAVSGEDYELIHTSAENIFVLVVRLKGLEELVPYKFDLNECLYSFANTLTNHNEFRLLSIRDSQNDDPEEPGYDWVILIIIEYQDPLTESEPFLTHLLQQTRKFWMTQHVNIKIYNAEYTKVSSVYQV